MCNSFAIVYNICRWCFRVYNPHSIHYRIKFKPRIKFYMKVIMLWHIITIYFNTLRPEQNRRYFADDIFKCVFENETEWISPRISLKFVPKVRINNIPALVQIMAWRLPGDKPLSEPMMVNLLTHICVTRPQWVKTKMVEVLSLFLPFGVLSSNMSCLRSWIIPLIT